jgi:CAI-1 autoinducer synthase
MEIDMFPQTNVLPKYDFINAPEPEFLARRINAYYRDRVQNTWGGGHILRGKVPDREAIRLLSNDYLALTSHPDILRAQADILLEEGNGMLMSGIFLLNGGSAQRELELRLAHFMCAEDGILCQSGYAANTGLLQSIASEGTPVYVDMFAHMSLWEGVRSAGAKAVPFYHNDAEHLQRQLLKYGPGVVVVDSVYSTNGSVCPLVDTVEVGVSGGCVLVVDESHSLGTHGPKGAGLVVSLGLTEKVHFRTASLAKAFAGRAGFITCSARFTDYFKCESLPAIFSSTLLPHEVAGLDTTLDIIQTEDWRRQKLHANANYLRVHLSEMGYNVEDSKSQIIALEPGPEQRLIVLRNALEERGIFGAPFFPPATSKNRTLMRFSISCDLTEQDMHRIIEACDEIREDVGLADWVSTRRRRTRVPEPKLRSDHPSDAAGDLKAVTIGVDASR